MTRNATIGGTLSATGPFAVWLVPLAMNCEVVYYKLAHVPVPCPPPFGVVPSYSWNLSMPAAGSVNLSVPFGGLGGGPGTIPPSSWVLIIANTGRATESVIVCSSITLGLV